MWRKIEKSVAAFEHSVVPFKKTDGPTNDASSSCHVGCVQLLLWCVIAGT